MNDCFPVTSMVEACVLQKSVKLTGTATHFVSIRIEVDYQGSFGSPPALLLRKSRVAFEDPPISGAARVSGQIPENNLT